MVGAMNRSDTPAIVGLGEILLRLSPPGRRKLMQARSLDLHIGGAEANVLASLARLDHHCRMVSAVPRSALGDAACAALRAHGVDTSHVVTGQGRMGVYFLEQGQGTRASSIIYDRADSAFAQASDDTLPLDHALAGAGLLHLTGITPALGAQSSLLAQAAADRASAAGITISFDGNFRAQLWAQWQGDAPRILAGLMSRANILFGNDRDIGLVLGRSFSGAASDRQREAALAAFDAFPDLNLIAATQRSVLHADHHQLRARVDTRDGWHESAVIDITGIVDRIGTGDAFAAGVLDRFIAGDSMAVMAETGLALAALKHSLPGDMALFNRADIANFMAGNRDVSR